MSRSVTPPDINTHTEAASEEQAQSTSGAGKTNMRILETPRQ